MDCKYITPSVTIFKADGTVDLEAMERHFDFLIQGGVDGILVLGSIGEFFSMPIEEKKKLIRCAVKHIAGRVKLIVGTTSMVTEEIIELSKFAHREGADACIILPPYYFPLSAASIENYYDHIASQLADQELYLYNFPDRTGYTIPVPTTLNLLRKHKNIKGYKDTQAGVSHTLELVKTVKKEFPYFEVYAGFDDNFAHNVLSGGNGCIGGLSNLVPEVCHAWVEAFRREDLAAAREVQMKINGLMEIYQVGTPFVPYIKSAIGRRGLEVSSKASFPFVTPTIDDLEKIDRILEKYGIEKVNG